MAHPWAQPGDTTATVAAEPAAVEPDLRHEIAELHALRGNPSNLLAAFRAALVHVPVLADQRPLTVERDGLRWLLAFTTEDDLGAFVAARQESGADWHFIAVRGHRLLDELVPALPDPTGVSLDIAGSRPMLLPPVKGVVPESAAIA